MIVDKDIGRWFVYDGQGHRSKLTVTGWIF